MSLVAFVSGIALITSLITGAALVAALVYAPLVAFTTIISTFVGYTGVLLMLVLGAILLSRQWHTQHPSHAVRRPR